MYEKVKAYMRMHHMVGKQEGIVAGVSGGADSICLLLVLAKLAREQELYIMAVHVNHGLRGEEADGDESFVREFCAGHKIPLTVIRADVGEYAREKGLSLEEAGREVRRKVFAQECDRLGAAKVALAHHMDDNAETMLMNLARGTGPFGMAGILPVSGKTIHPLLCVRREEIEAWLGERGIEYCTDQTNLEDTYTRNRIRRQVLPLMSEQVNSKAVEHINSLGKQMQELRAYIERQVEKRYEQCVQLEEKDGKRGSLVLKETQVDQTDPALRPYLIRRAIAAAAHREKDIGAVHIDAVSQLFGKQVGRRISLPYSLIAERVYQGVRIFQEESARQPASKQESRRIEEKGVKVEMRIFQCQGIPETFPTDPYTKWFDCDIIQNDVILRTGEPGDYLTIDREGHKQKLGRYFINEKIPKEERKRILLAADGDQIMWVVGRRQNQHYQVTEKTRRILEIKLSDYKGESYGRNNQSTGVGRGDKQEGA